MLRVLVGSGDRIALFALPVVVIGLALNLAFPAFFAVGGPSAPLRYFSLAVLVLGVATWAWSVVLILKHVPHGELITSGPYAIVKHPLYAGVALLVIPWVGFLLNSWLGVLIGLAFYAGSRLFAPAEERSLAESFGPAWDAYASNVTFPWL